MMNFAQAITCVGNHCVEKQHFFVNFDILAILFYNRLFQYGELVSKYFEPRKVALVIPANYKIPLLHGHLKSFLSTSACQLEDCTVYVVYLYRFQGYSRRR